MVRGSFFKSFSADSGTIPFVLATEFPNCDTKLTRFDARSKRKIFECPFPEFDSESMDLFDCPVSSHFQNRIARVFPIEHAHSSKSSAHRFCVRDQSSLKSSRIQSMGFQLRLKSSKVHMID
jgi:hypothetical protein